jgi:hypothetical protein
VKIYNFTGFDWVTEYNEVFCTVVKQLKKCILIYYCYFLILFIIIIIIIYNFIITKLKMLALLEQAQFMTLLMKTR